MAARGGGIPGLAVTFATIGGFLLYIGIRNVPILDGLREIIKGQVPTPRPKQTLTVPDYLQPTRFEQADDGSLFKDVEGSVISGTPRTNSQIANAAMKYVGTPYVWGGATPQPGFDCSGLVTWVLVKDMGMTNLPSQSHTVTGQFWNWKGASDVTREKCAPGDLICWLGHIGIAVSATEMVHAPDIGQRVKVSPIWWAPAPRVRRVNVMATGSNNTSGNGGNQAI